MYDAIVVGARCAGAPTAMLLARGGRRVLLLDRATFPRDTLSTHYIHQSGVARLARWGLLDAARRDRLPADPPLPLRRRPVRADGLPPPIDGVDAAYSPRRYVLDAAAGRRGRRGRRRGARRASRCEALLTDGDRVVGVRGRTRAAASARERARS